MGRRLAVLAVVAIAAGALLRALPSTGTLQRTAPPRSDYFALDDTAVPDDTALTAQLERAVDLRLREDFDRMLDARDPGELIEHATLSETALDRNVLGIDTLFVIGDELFGYAFRPENGWGRGKGNRKAADYTPRLRRVHLGEGGGPDAFE